MHVDWSKRPKKQLGIALILILIATLFSTLMGAIAKFLAPHQTAEAIVFWRNFVGLLLFFPWILFSSPRFHLSEKLRINHLKLPLIRGVASVLAIFSYYYSLRYLSLTEATLLFNTIPIFAPLVSFIWLRVKIFHSLWWGIATAFLGIILVLKPGTTIFQPASLIALGSGILGAISMIALRVSHFSETFERNIFYLFTIGFLGMGIATLFSFSASWGSLNLTEIAWLIGIGITGLLYQIFLTLSSKHAPIRFISIFLYTAVIYAILFDRLIWNTPIPLSTYLGFALIVAGALLLVFLYPKEDLQFKK